GSANLDDLKLALKRRDLLEEGMRNELDEFVKQGGYSGGLAVVVLKNQREQIEILKGKDVKAQIALLAGARYLCDKLPIDSLKELLLKADKPLTSAVQDYLAVEGSAAARKLIQGQHPNELKILGEISCLSEYQDELSEIKAWEEKLRREVLAPGGVEEIYALSPVIPSKRLKGIVIRVRGGKAESSVYETAERRKIRMLTGSELRELKDF